MNYLARIDMKSINTYKTAGLDGIFPKFTQVDFNVLISILIKIFRASHVLEYFPKYFEPYSFLPVIDRWLYLKTFN